MEYAVYITLALCVIVIGLLIMMIFKKQKDVPSAEIDDTKIIKSQAEFSGEIKSKLDSLKGELENYLKNSIKDEIINLKTELNDSNTASRKTVEEFKTTISENINTKFAEIDNKMNDRIKEILQNTKNSLETGFDQTNKSYKELVEQLTLIGQAKDNIESLSNEVISLKNVLENNQNRGRFGELALERILFSIFGDAKEGVYAFQYNLKNYEVDERPDAVIFLPEPNKLLCIDSKFPYADYKGIIEAETPELREESKKGFGLAVKKHITDVAKKYIIKNTTADYAFLFIPSDAIFGFINSELETVVEYARSKNVILTSPSTLQPLLATINLVKLQYERKKNIDKIIKLIGDLGKKFNSFIGSWDKLSNRVRQLDEERANVDKTVRNITDQFNKIENVQGIELNNEE